MINPKFAEILTILNTTHNTGASTKELFKAITDNLTSNITDPEVLSKLLYSMRCEKLITTSDAGKNRAHKITHHGIRALDEYNSATSQEHETQAIITETEPATAEPEPGPEPEPEPETPAEPQAKMEQITKHPGIMTDNTFYLDPNNEFESAMITIASALREIRQQPPAPKITHKEQKLSTLNRLGALMSDDIRDIFAGIAHDISRLDEI